MKTIYKFIILAIFAFLLMYSISGCSSSTDPSSTSTGQQTISASDYKIKFPGDIWSSVVFHHKEHADRFGDCYECHYCAGVQGESLWNCRSCHSPGNTEGLCQDDGTHGCIMAQCDYCHEDLERNPGLDCIACHTDGALANIGHFVDSPVKGLNYQTNTISGITDDAGTFYFRDGETISFFIEDLFLGTASAKTLMTPLDLIEGATDVTNPAVTNICRLLLSLDVDGNPDNGITISDAIKSELEGRSINFNQSTGDFGSDPNVLALFDTLNQLGVFTDNEVRSLCSATEAQDHLTETLLSSNEEPIATNVAISGYPYVTYTLTGTYVYQDNDGDLESGSIYKWYRYDDDQGANEQEISGATSTTYILTNADVGKYLKFEVIPSASAGKSPGNPVKSDAVGPITPDPGNLPPTASMPSGILIESAGVAGVIGVYHQNGTLNGKLLYKHDTDNYWIYYDVDSSGWKIGADTNPDNSLYMAGDYATPPYGWWQKYWGNYTNGAAYVIINDGISGNAWVGSTLTATYYYNDYEGDQQSGSTYQWYRYDDGTGTNEVLITGANSTSYVPVTADIGKYLKFEVTPGAATGNTPGVPVKSASIGPITHTTKYTGEISSASEVDHWPIHLSATSNIVIDVQAWESCGAKPIPSDFFDDGHNNNWLYADFYLFTSTGIFVDRAVDGPGAHSTRTGRHPSYLSLNNLAAGDYIIAIGSMQLSQADAWNGTNSDTDNSQWRNEDWDGNPTTNYYNILITISTP